MSAAQSIFPPRNSVSTSAPLHEKELGYVSLNEITSIRGPMGLAIECDLFWSPKKLGDIA
ncbi:MAG: DUF2958 domain-containing protein, partial [Gammaproteobacteria bacterium]|nr:DUF2958 domain-containing protein [Gammaproteobacteria bacterium]